MHHRPAPHRSRAVEEDALREVRVCLLAADPLSNDQQGSPMLSTEEEEYRPLIRKRDCAGAHAYEVRRSELAERLHEALQIFVEEVY
jgi:hypothetical protein